MKIWDNSNQDDFKNDNFKTKMFTIANSNLKSFPPPDRKYFASYYIGEEQGANKNHENNKEYLKRRLPNFFYLHSTQDSKNSCL